MRKITYYIRRPGYYLSVAFRDIPFTIIFITLSLKLLYFDHINGLKTLSFAADFGVIVIMLAFSLLIKNNIFKIIYLLFLNLVFSFIFLAHSLYRAYFEDFASAYYLEQIPLLLGVSDSVIYLIKNKFLFFIDFAILPFLLLKLKNKYAFNIKERIVSLIIFFLLGLYCNLTVISSILGGLNAFTFIGERYICVWDVGIINYQLFDLYGFLTSKIKKVSLTQSDINSVKAWVKNNKRSGTNDWTAIGERNNLIIIQLESMQNFVVGKRFHGREITPNLNKLAKEGIYFTNIYDQTAAGSSADATLLANSSLYPARTGAASFLYGENCFDSLPKVLRKHGYVTAAMHPNVKSFWNSAVFEKSLGFERQFYKNEFVINDTIGLGLSDRTFFLQSYEKIKQLPTPFYAFLRTLTAHFPYDYVKKEIDNFPLSDMEGKITGHYFRTTHYVDAAIGEFLHKLSESNLSKNTIIAIYSDHRARLPEDELKQMGIKFLNEYKRIPLIIYIPNKELSIERDTIGGLIDVAPTLCNILGIDISHTLFVGIDLMSNHQGFVIFRDGSYISKDNSTDGGLVQKQLLISDLILEKDIVPFVNKRVACY
jgi:lipoteichoic acid synthase